MSLRSLPSYLLLAVLATLALAPAAARGQSGEWTGWITDESCGAKGANRAHEKCARKCHEGGALLVFFNNADGRIYKLDDQAAAEANLGHEVRVRGDLHETTIRVAAIERAGH